MRILFSSMLLLMVGLGLYASAFAGDDANAPASFDKVFRVDSRP
jgi:hypothetical protein